MMIVVEIQKIHLIYVLVLAQDPIYITRNMSHCHLYIIFYIHFIILHVINYNVMHQTYKHDTCHLHFIQHI
jgi:hypothetical protein